MGSGANPLVGKGGVGVKVLLLKYGADGEGATKGPGGVLKALPAVEGTEPM